MDSKALHKIGYGLYVIGSKKGDKLNGQIANTVFQITSEPPTVAVSINKNNLTYEYIKESRVFTVTILCEATPLSFIGNFGFKSGRDVNKLEGVEYKIGKTGVPVITENATACLEVNVTQEVDVGTHALFIGEIVEAEVISEETCMTYAHYHIVKRGTTPKSAPSYIKETQEEKTEMAKYKCTVCGYIYDPELGDPDGGIEPGTPFEDIPDDWVCPICGARKEEFEKLE